MNDALSNVLNLAANMPTNDGAIQTKSQQAGERRLTKQRFHEESLQLDELTAELLDSQDRGIVT